jgi:hypothetical protein
VILSEFQKRAGERLLQQIAEKTEEIKNLRDGVTLSNYPVSTTGDRCLTNTITHQLFNANSLREASRSTTMNRYIIVFTVFTVLYLPLSFTTVFCSYRNLTKPLANRLARPCSAHRFSKARRKPRPSSASRY